MNLDYLQGFNRISLPIDNTHELILLKIQMRESTFLLKVPICLYMLYA